MKECGKNKKRRSTGPARNIERGTEKKMLPIILGLEMYHAIQGAAEAANVSKATWIREAVAAKLKNERKKK